MPTGGTGLALAPCDPAAAMQGDTPALGQQPQAAASSPLSVRQQRKSTPGPFASGQSSPLAPDTTKPPLLGGDSRGVDWFQSQRCTNQRIELVGEGAGDSPGMVGSVGTLKVARSGNCLTWSTPAPPVPPIVTFDKLGVMDYKTYESTPVVINGIQILIETITLAYPRHISHWDPVTSNPRLVTPHPLPRGGEQSAHFLFVF